MKKIIGLILCFCVLTGCVENKDSSSSSSNSSETTGRRNPSDITTAATTTARPLDMTTWKDNYRVFLTDIIDNDTNHENYNFNVADINRDGTPELLYTIGDTQINGVRLFAFVDGEVKEVGEFGEFGKFRYNPSNGYIYDDNLNQASLSNSIYEYKDGTATLLVSFEDNSEFTDTDGEVYYKLNGNEVTKEEYDAEFNKYYGDTVETQLSEISGTLPFTELQIMLVFNKD
jgi:hypothetical protein